MQPFHRLARPLLLALGLAAASGGALAETSPWYLGVNQGFSYDSNVFRLPEAFEQSSWWSSSALVGGLDQRYGRQRFYANGTVALNRYSSLDQLNNTSYNLSGGWDWETINRLSGQLYASYAENLGNYGGFYDTLITQKNVERRIAANASVNYGLASLLAAQARLAYSSVRYSAPQYAGWELDQASITLSLDKEFSGQLRLGPGVAYTSGDYAAINRDFSRYDLFLTGRWMLTGLSTLSGRVGYSSWSYGGLNPYDQSSVTGWITWRYLPTGKLAFDTTLSYDTLANTGLTDMGGGAVGSQGDTNRLTTGIRIAATYQLTGKTSLNASLQFYRRTQDYSINPPPGLPPLPVEIRDQVTNLSLGGTWVPRRNWQVNCNLYLASRNQSTNQPLIAMTPYDAYGGNCAVQFVLQ